MASWTKQVFASVGVTESPPGPGLSDLQRRFGGGRVILALDVSGSMAGDRLAQAKVGCQRFIAEAIEARYEVGLTLWHSGIDAHSSISTSPEPALRLLARASAGGGNDIVPTLELAHVELMQGPPVDMVLAIFGDGDLGNPTAAKRASEPLIADNIRIITCGLGSASAESLAEIATEASADRAATADTIADGPASMARALIRKG